MLLLGAGAVVLGKRGLGGIEGRQQSRLFLALHQTEESSCGVRGGRGGGQGMRGAPCIIFNVRCLQVLS